ncbi:hypothetical protein M0R72_00970 [Candidatus Pacearchaeota archaeon]|jgi:hypothetical protein|nr:hypothetical protein [Candidatus Pacearchaeota archaeon]
MTKLARIPTPEDLWGDCEVTGWDERHTSLWKLWLRGIAAIIVFAEQSVIDRVEEVVRLTTAKAKAGDLTAEEAVWLVSPLVLISSKEWDTINAIAREQGQMVGNFFLSDEFTSNN